MLLQLPHKTLLLGLWLVLLTPPAMAQSVTPNWDALQTLKPGANLTIKTKAGRKLKGKFKRFAAESVTLEDRKVAGQEIEVARADIAEIRKKSGARMASYAAVFGGLGFAGGYGIGYGIGEAKRSRYRVEYPMAVMGAGIGAAIGAFIGSRGEVIYKSP